MKTLSINCTLFSRLAKPLIILALCLFYSMSWAQEMDSTLRSRVVSLDLNQFASQLSAAPMERSSNARSAPFLMDLPMPDGTERTFSIVESPIVDPEFAARYPTFKTYMVQDVENPAISGRISVTPYGYHHIGCQY